MLEDVTEAFRERTAGRKSILRRDTSRMLYDTRNNRTRIVGYREGNVYLLKDHIVYKNVLENWRAEREMYDLGQGKACSGMRKMENIRMFILNGMEYYMV